MIMGGIPYYLRLLDRELSLNENIDALFFKKRAELWDEFDQLYKTLFSNSEKYIKIVEALSRKRIGLTRNEIVVATKISENGALTKMLSDLVNSGFVRCSEDFCHKIRDRRDKTINLCEIKFSSKEFEIDKDYDLNLKNKVAVFREVTKTNKTLQITMITTYGIKKNKYSNYVGKVIGLDDLFTQIEN